VIKHGYRCFNS